MLARLRARIKINAMISLDDRFILTRTFISVGIATLFICPLVYGRGSMVYPQSSGTKLAGSRQHLQRPVRRSEEITVAGPQHQATLQRYKSGVFLLQQVRPNISYEKYPAAEKKYLAQRASNFLAHFYINRPMKLKKFKANIFESLKQIRRNSSNLTSEEFHRQMRQAFASQKDYHLSYSMPDPLRSFKSFLPFDVVMAYDANHKPVVAIESLRKDLLNALEGKAQLKQTLSALEPGDIITEVEGQSVWRHLHQLSSQTSGCNPASRLTHNLQYMTTRYHSRDLLPDKNWLTIKVKKSDGKVEHLSVPWITKGNRYDYQRAENNDPQKKTLIPYKNVTVEGRIGDHLQYGKVTNRNGTFGYIRMDAFNLSDGQDLIRTNDFCYRMADVLQQYNQNTQGLIIDLRNNGGGSFPLSQQWPKLYSQGEFKPLQLRSTTTKDKQQYFYGYSQDYKVPYLLAGRREKSFFSKPYPAENPADAAYSDIRDIHGVYKKPVAVLVNGRTFSAGDAFTASMQDNGLACIYGENGKSTGGGGALVSSYNEIYTMVQNTLKRRYNRFLPHNIDFNCAIEQHVRRGKYQGQLIETAGVKAEKVVFRSLKSVRQGKLDYLDNITFDLAKKNRQRCR